MPKIVDKSQKRKNIAKSTCSLFIEQGFVNISISQIAKVAGIGKGTIYEYFKNKEDIVLELMGCLQEEYDPKLQHNLSKEISVEKKVIYLFDIFLNDDETTQAQRKIYKEFLAIYLNNPTDEIIEYHNQLKEKYLTILTNILQEYITKKEIKKEVLLFVPSLIATVEGFFIANEKKEYIVEYINNLFKLLKI
ncbi:MAG: TetR/AcrR family transcriptional regulator [Campylobacterota bacterium]|nr:TetR/AcrR family transcriptional regulator [Campylobacterota bacterium]